ncbi:CRISPR-associated protein Cas4 [Mucisphaera calidilacus]|uniref:CRISPR-associated exonuclease Cas4 n=1 Tax=Mucisphaera calidilacus TaxID=2527982 RepID=A0A518C081_9BACT|nr:CRISPR-associated protein Cas4 [Mucisphaera calidilacus]QDU72623.1 PD-(D/E)XK nuclease superfamily protein [Mucisphaera calidilacus]
MAGYADEDLIPISALQHYLFCPRQCALIHVDGLWAENRLTSEGKVLHERSDTPGHRTRAVEDHGVRCVRAMPLVHRRLGLTGRADVVEFPLDSEGCPAGPPRPVEHKRGNPKRLDHDRVQLAAQAICLEEMLGVEVPKGELFYHAVRRRETVTIDAHLRKVVERTVDEVRGYLETNTVPAAKQEPKCRNCSLLHLCMPAATGLSRRPGQYLIRSLRISLDTEGSP